MPAAAEAFFTVDELSFRFPSMGALPSRAVLDRVGMEAARGAAAVLLGRADAGKTTLARICAGLLPRFTGGAIQGSVSVDGQGIRGVPPYELLQTVGLVAQDSDEQLLTTRCDTEVAFSLESLGVPRPEMRRRVSESLERWGLAGFDSRNPSTLSGGEKKRLLLACLDAIAPRLWILDEALGELDFDWKLRVLDLVGERGGTVLLTESRWTPLVEERGSSYFLLEGGTVAARADGRPEPAFTDALLRRGIALKPSLPPRADGREGGLEIRGLQHSYTGETGFHLDIRRLVVSFGETCALVGRNGSGKSTLGKILCGLFPARAGEIRLSRGGPARPADPGELSACVGYLFQNPDHQIFLPTVREELALGLRGSGASPRQVEERVREAAEKFGLADLEAPPALLSYGARRRLQAACYYLLERDLLILDEIDSGLSYGEIQSLLDALRTRVAGLVLITHDLPLARAAAHRVLVMEAGSVTDDRGGRP